MAVKEWFRRLQPAQLYLVLFFTVAFFAVEIVASYVTHALTLLMNAYHMLCNIVALVGCIASIKYQNADSKSNENSMNSLKMSTNSLHEKSLELTTKKSKQTRSEKRMKNTFGWARIDVVTMLVCCVLLASFCFSLLIEALQTLIHIGHLDEMHHPLPVMSIGASGVLLNAFCYFLIGGYTFNQGVFLHFAKNGSIILKRTISSQSPKANDGEATGRRSPLELSKGQGALEMCRDVLGCILVMVTSIIVYFTDRHIAKYVDPIFAIISAVSLFLMSYPYMKESGLILLQTIPNHINIDSLQKDLLAAFPEILNVHDLHVWQLNSEKVVSTVHIIYADPSVCARINDQITSFFIEMGITHVTIQPEFCSTKLKDNPFNDCLIRCQSKNCSGSTCCSRNELDEVLHDHHHHHHHHGEHGHRHIVNKRFGSKEILPRCSSVDLKRFSSNVDELSETYSAASAKDAADKAIEEERVEETRKKDDEIVPSDCCRTVDVDVVKSAIASESEKLTVTKCADDDDSPCDDKVATSDS